MYVCMPVCVCLCNVSTVCVCVCLFGAWMDGRPQGHGFRHLSPLRLPVSSSLQPLAACAPVLAAPCTALAAAGRRQQQRLRDMVGGGDGAVAGNEVVGDCGRYADALQRHPVPCAWRCSTYLHHPARPRRAAPHNARVHRNALHRGRVQRTPSPPHTHTNTTKCYCCDLGAVPVTAGDLPTRGSRRPPLPLLLC